MADRGCNLECVKGGDNAIEFVGPVKIVLVDQPKSAYLRKTCYAALIVLAQMMMATTTILVMFYSLSYKRSACFKALHVFLCTVGLQIIMLSGILSLNNLTGSSAPMKISDCRFEHVFLEWFGLASSVAGIITIFFSEYSSLFTAHSCSGIAATGMAILCAISGLFVYDFRSAAKLPEEYSPFRRFVNYTHQFLGSLAILLSSVCFILGVTKTSFIKWLPLYDMHYYAVMFCIFYTIVILYKPLKQLVYIFFLFCVTYDSVKIPAQNMEQPEWGTTSTLEKVTTK